jgi:hypothetical protein
MKKASKTKWKPRDEDTNNLAEIRWYALTLEKMLMEMYWTNRKRWPDLRKQLDADFKALKASFTEPRPGLADDDDCPDGQTRCSDGYCKPVCDEFD